MCAEADFVLFLGIEVAAEVDGEKGNYSSTV